jgi:PEP-CTERM motif
MKKWILMAVATMGAVGLEAAPIQTLPGLVAIRFLEVSGTTNTFSFVPNNPRLTTQLVGLSLNAQSADFIGAPLEHYDVFYSNAAGVLDANGDYITIESKFLFNGVGMNIAEVILDFGGLGTVNANTISAFTPGFAGYVANSQLNAADGNPATFSSLGRTSGVDGNEEIRMSLTLGFPAAPSGNSAVPEPSTWALMLAGGGLLAYRGRKR